MSRRLFSVSLCLIALAALFAGGAPPAFAQSASTGRVAGQVTDRQGAMIVGAEVILTNTETSSKLRGVTNEVGRYLILNVNPGVYDVTVSMAGFSQTRLRAQNVAVGLELTLNASLEVGSVTTSVEVQALAGAELQTSNSTVGSTVSGVSLMNLPNLGRDANAFLALQPAVTPGGQVAGVVQDQSQFQLDGGNNSDDQEGGHGYNIAPGNMGIGGPAVPSGVMPTPVETIEEFKVGISNQSADFNGAAGSQVQMVSKRGTNRFHGSAYDHYFAGNMGANTWQGNHTPSAGLPYTPLPSTHQSRFGASLGGPLTPAFWGGKTYFFFNYEGRRFPNVATYERPVPTALMRAGIIQVANSSGQMIPYNLNPAPVTVNGATYQPAACPAGPCDPRGVGINPIVSQIWNKYMPLPNDPNFGDRFNTQGYFTTLALPQNSNFLMTRIDHDFGINWRFTAGYRYYKFLQMTNQQVDIGGFLAGNTLGNAVATAPRRQTPSYWVAGLSGVLTPHLVNDFHFSFLRNAWEWITAGGPIQLPGLGGAALIGGSGGGQLIPIQVDRGSGLARYWDGMDTVFRDDLNWIKGNHAFQFGGQYQRNNIKHQRNDNGINIYNQTGYEITSGAGIVMPTSLIPANVASNQIGSYSSLYAISLGMVAQTQLMYARKGGQLLPPGSPIFSQNIIPNYNLYFGDTWRIRPTVTLSYGLGYEVQMPVREVDGNVPMITDAQGNAFTGEAYLAQRKSAALAGQVYNPTLGFATIRNVVGNPSYPYNPFYGGIGPRFSAAWNPKYTDGLLGKLLGANKTVFRGGYSRRYGRINGINVIQVPLQGIGIGQTVQCTGVSRAGQCLGVAGVDPSNAFRIGVDGLVAPLPSVSQQLPQPFLPGVGANASAATAWSDDPSLKPSHIDQVNFTIQREITSRIRMELGYIGTRSRDEQLAYSLDSVPYMTTLGGQAFSQAFANTYLALSASQTPGPQAFFESALGGPNSAYCSGFANCTAALASKQRSSILTTSVYNLWAAMNAAPGWTLGRTMPSSNPIQALALPQAASFGYSNYNGAFLSARVTDFHGLTASSNLTFSRALGTGGYGSGIGVPVDMWNISSMYGRQPFDINWIYNLSMYYRPKFFEQSHGILGHIAGGWGFAPLFTAQSGVPLGVSSSSNCQSFGQANCSYLGGAEQAIATAALTGGNEAHYNVVSSGVAGQSGNASRGGSGVNLFADPSAVYSNFRRVILGVDTRPGGAGPLRGFPTWNLDLAVMKDLKIKEGIGATLSFQFVNVLNHFQPANPGLNIDSPASFGVITGQSNPPRQLEFGLRLFF